MVGVVFIGDDFTGASDTLATLAERGAKVRLFLDAPSQEETIGLDAVGIATDLRARSPGEIAGRLEALAPAVRALAPRFLHYKVCSTFDSAPHVGSIGAAVLALEKALNPARTIILGGQPSLGRHCIFGTLFARGPDGAVHRIDRHPIMSRHPVTPMGEADLRVHLRQQGLDAIGLLSHLHLQSAANDQDGELGRAGRTLVDALSQCDVDRLGGRLRALAAETAPLLIVGASSVAEALYPPIELATPRISPRPAPGSRLVVAGSRSSVTAAQVSAATSYQRLPLDRDHLGAGQTLLAQHCAGLLSSNQNVLIHLQNDFDYGLNSAMLSDLLAELTASIASLHCPTAIAVAGGDTSSAVVNRLGFRSLSFIERAGSGVAVCRGHAPGSPVDGTVLLLKGGQVGDVDVLERFSDRSTG